MLIQNNSQNFKILFQTKDIFIYQSILSEKNLMQILSKINFEMPKDM